MSGIFGIINLNTAPLASGDLEKMASMLIRRGPERIGLHRAESVGLGHTLLATTPEAVWEQLPLLHASSGCVITGDVRLDNRDELLGLLGLRDRAREIGDVELTLQAYLRWGASCVDNFLGDFVFAIWDPRQRRLFCARDHFGMRPFYYHHSPGRFFAFASEPRALLVLEQTPYRINQGRIADFLVQELEGIDYTSTFFEDVYRLPPAHSVSVGADRFDLKKYWTLEAGPELKLASDGEYAEAFLDVFREAVRSRLRCAGPIGSMLSGGIDSGAVVAVGSDLLSDADDAPLRTFSATSPDFDGCLETRTISVSLGLPRLRSVVVHHGQLLEVEPRLSELTWSADEPFDGHMTLPRMMYLEANLHGVKVLLDGLTGDMVLSEANYIARLLRSGRWVSAVQETVGQNRFWKGEYPAARWLFMYGRSAFASRGIKRLRAKAFGARRTRDHAARLIRSSHMNANFASSVNLGGRVKAMTDLSRGGMNGSFGEDCVASFSQPHVVVARERYNRVGSSLGVEPRDPFSDRRLVSFSMSLPGAQKLARGWPKIILRNAMAGLLPDEVRWREGKEHLGWAFTESWAQSTFAGIRDRLNHDRPLLEPFVRRDSLERWTRPSHAFANLAEKQQAYEVCRLGTWLRTNSRRPMSQDAVS